MFGLGNRNNVIDLGPLQAWGLRVYWDEGLNGVCAW